MVFNNCWVMMGDLDSDPVSLEIHSAVVRGWGKTAANAQVVKVELTAHWYTGRPKSPWHP